MLSGNQYIYLHLVFSQLLIRFTRVSSHNQCGVRIENFSFSVRLVSSHKFFRIYGCQLQAIGYLFKILTKDIKAYWMKDPDL